MSPRGPHWGEAEMARLDFFDAPVEPVDLPEVDRRDEILAGPHGDAPVRVYTPGALAALDAEGLRGAVVRLRSDAASLVEVPGEDERSLVRVAGAVVGAGAAAEVLGTSGTDLTLVWGDLTVSTEEPNGARQITLPAQGPAAWCTLPELEHVSGTALYTVTVVADDGDVPAPEQLAGVRLGLGPVGGVAVVRVAGRELATVMRPDVVVPVGKDLAEEVTAGREAVLEIEVRTTLRNATLAADVYTKEPWAVEHPSVPHGLLGPVRLLSRE